MKNTVLSLFMAAAAVMLPGCSTNVERLTQSTGSKNVGIDGYVMYGKVDAASDSTAMPTGQMILGRLVYKSRRVGIPANQQVPNTGNFKSTWSKSLFGTEEHIIEYDFTAGNKSEALETEKKLEKLKQDCSTSPQK